MRIRIWIFILFIFGSTVYTATGQWDPSVSQYMNNQLSFNPAFAGVRNTIYASVNTKKQWIGIEGSPEAYQLSIHAPVNKTLNALGGNAFVYQMGPVQYSSANFVFAHLLKLNKRAYLSLGMSGGVVHQMLKMNQINVVNETDPLFQGDNMNQTALDVGFGGWLYGPKFYVGLSFPHILHTQSSKEITMPALMRHVYLMGGYDFQIEEVLTIKPSVLLRAVSNMETLTDISTVFEYKTRIAVGFSYRLEESLVLMTSLWLNKNIGVGYAYDIGSSQNGIGRPSHEISINYENFKFVRKNKKRTFRKKKKEPEGIRSMRHF